MANNGVLGCSILKEVDVELNARWANNGYSDTAGVIKAGTLNALLAEQTASFEELADNTVKNKPKVKLTWLEDCPIDTQDCNISCDAPTTGVEFGDNCQDVEITKCREAVTIKIDEHKIADSTFDFEDILTRAVARADQAIAEYLNIEAITMLHGLTDINRNDNTMGGLITPAAAAGTYTELGSAIATSPMNYLAETEALNDYSDPYLIGGRFFQPYAMDTVRATNPIFKGEGLTNYDGWKHYFDVRSFDKQTAVVDPALGNTMFMLNRGEFAFLNSYQYPDIANRIEFGHNQFSYRMRSPILSDYLATGDVFYDVDYWVKCETTNGRKRNVHCWQIRLNYDWAQSPKSCTGQSRVLGFTCK